MGYLIALGIVGLLLLAAAVVAAWWLWRKGRTGRAFVVALAALGVWQVYTAVYPSDSFYKAEFEKVTGTKFPPDAQIMFKRASFPDLFGDYTSCALINVATQEYERLLNRALQTGIQAQFIHNDCWSELIKQVQGASFAAEASAQNVHRSDEFTYWALVKGQHKVAILYVTW